MGLWAGIKYALNSSLGTDYFMPLDAMIGQSIGPDKYEIGTPGTYSIKIPYGVKSARINAFAGGGGGAGGYYSASRGGGGGGGGGEVVEAYNWDITPDMWNKTIQVVVGAGGAGGTGNTAVTENRRGKDGGTSWIEGVMILQGGHGGTDNYGGAAGGASAGAGGNERAKGGNSIRAAGGEYNAVNAVGGGGGASWGNGAYATNITGKNNNGSQGSGGAGGFNNYDGGDGGSGGVYIYFKWA